MLYHHLRTHLIVAPSTSVGKSIFSTGLCRASSALGERVGYLKPIGTGSGDGDDEAHLKRFAPRASTACLFHFDEPVSPHLAVQRASSSTSPAAHSTYPTDDHFVSAVSRHVHDFARQSADELGASDRARPAAALYIESAGGVHSPTLSGSSQLDAYRSLRPPTLLIASHALGGISTTVSAYESLLLRGYDIDSILVFKEDYYENHTYFQRYFEQERNIRVGVVPCPPERAASAPEDQRNMERYYSSLEAPLGHIVDHLAQKHTSRIDDLKSMARRSRETFWWPFVQHAQIERDEDVLVVDSAHGDHFITLQQPTTPPRANEDRSTAALLGPTVDGSASWWTQALGHSNPELALSAARAAGRYGHVLFPSATNEPSLRLAETLLQGVGDGWASRVFFSDDGSTGMEVALKMALRSYAVRKELDPVRASKLHVLGFKGSYHGDTLGAVDACEKSVFTERIDWYHGRGAWLDGAQAMIERGRVVIRDRATGESIGEFEDLAKLYDVEQRLLDRDPLIDRYRSEIIEFVSSRQKEGVEFGALVLEPIVMGAGGMIFLDPLYQRVLIDLVRSDSNLFPCRTTSNSTTAWQGLPIIFDEVFVGLHRLGPITSSTLLGSSIHPDIAVYAKILSGGLVPLSVTLASSSIFDTFLGPGKVDALLHGHSYTAHPIGCSVALTTLEILNKIETKGEWDAAKIDWQAIPSTATSSPLEKDSSSSTQPWSFWSKSFISRLSHLEDQVQGVMTLGTVLVIYLRSKSDQGGYESSASIDLLSRLKQDRIQGGLWEGGSNVHARPLGNVVYFMASLNSKQVALRSLEQGIWDALTT